MRNAVDSSKKTTYTISYNKQSEKHVILAKLTQVYFSVVLNDPDGAALVESSGPLPANALYVNKVNYGRLGILKIETSYSAEEIQAALDFHYSQGAQSAHAAANVDYDKIFSDIEINGFFFGGDSANGMVPINCTRETCASKLDEFNRYVRDGLRLDAIVSSDLARARQTAQPVADALGLAVQMAPGLRERAYGDFQGLDTVGIAARFPAAA